MPHARCWRSALIDMQSILDSLDRASLPTQDYCGGDEDGPTREQVERVEQAIEQAFRALL